MHFRESKFGIGIQMSHNFVFNCSIHTKPRLVQLTAWRLTSITWCNHHMSPLGHTGLTNLGLVPHMCIMKTALIPQDTHICINSPFIHITPDTENSAQQRWAKSKIQWSICLSGLVPQNIVGAVIYGLIRSNRWREFSTISNHLVACDIHHSKEIKESDDIMEHASIINHCDKE